MTEGTDWRYIARISKAFVRRKKRFTQLLSAGAIALLICWLLGGIGLPFMFANSGGWLERAGQFGDMFGAVNSLFSAIALLGVAAALVLQLQDLKESKEVAHKVALVQSHVALADFRYKLLCSVADHDLRRGEKLRAEYHAGRAAELMKSLGEQLTELDELSRVSFDADGGRLQLDEIAFTLCHGAFGRGANPSENVAALKLINESSVELSMWEQRYGHLYPKAALDTVRRCRESLGNMPLDVIRSPLYGGDEQEWNAFWSKLAAIAVPMLTCMKDIKPSGDMNGGRC